MSKYIRTDFRNHPILFVDRRLSKEEKKPGLYYYAIRHDDEQWLPATIEEAVLVNHYGTIISKEKLDLDVPEWRGGYYINLSEEESDEFLYVNKLVTLDEYLEEVGYGVKCRVFLGIPSIRIHGKEYKVSIFDRKGYFNKGTAYIFNDWVLPYKGTLQETVGKYLEPGVYKHHEHIFLLFPIYDEEHVYNIGNLEE